MTDGPTLELPSLEIPAIAELAQLPRWVLWRRVERDERTTKEPLTVRGTLASSTDPTTWSSFSDCAGAFVRGAGDGLGFVFTPGGGYFGIDLDKCISSEGLSEHAARIVRELNSYTERSPSGQGLHIIGHGKLPAGRRRKDGIEMYDEGRFFTVTGDVWGGLDSIEDRTAEVAALHAMVFKYVVNGERVEYESEPWDGTLPPRIDAAIDNDPEIRRRWKGDASGLSDTSDSGIDLSFAKLLKIRIGCSGPELEAALRARRAKIGRPKHDGYFRKTVRTALTSGAGMNATPEEPDRPRIVVTGRQLREPLGETQKALLQSNQPERLFNRGGRTTYVGVDRDGHPRVLDVGEALMIGEMTDAADFITVRKSKEGVAVEASVFPPKAVAQAILAAADSPFPVIDGVCESPTLRSDGTILCKTGYDPASRLYLALAPDFEMPAVPEAPTAAEMLAEVQIIDDIIGDFPFETPASRATVFAALLTVVCRLLIQGMSPGFLFYAPTPGNGKTLLAQVISQIVAGTPECSPIPESEAEWRKTITTQLVGGASIVIFDNLRERLDSASVANVLTNPLWADRLLGKNEKARIKNTTVWMFTGNNLTVSDEIARRAAWCRIDAKVAKPAERTGFKHAGLLAYAGQQRNRALAALLTLARGWIANGRPGPDSTVPQLGSFERWRGVIGGILRVAQVPGFLGNLRDLHELVSPEQGEWARFLTVLADHFCGSAFAVSRLAIDLKNAPLGTLMEALPSEITWDDRAETKWKQRVGHAFERLRERRYPAPQGGTLRIDRDPTDTHAKVARWRVVHE
jgi:hypothetical protein